METDWNGYINRIKIHFLTIIVLKITSYQLQNEISIANKQKNYVKL